MQRLDRLASVPDDELLRRLARLLGGSRRTEADLVARIAEVDTPRLYVREATPSMFAYCLERLHLSEHEAYLRIAAARASREQPVILDMLADGRLHLSAIALLAPHLTRESGDALLEQATHKTKREVEEIVAELAPRPDVRPTIRKLPLGRILPSSAPVQRDSPVSPLLRPEQVDSGSLSGLVAMVSGTSLAPASGPQPEASAAEAVPADTCRAGYALGWAPSTKAQNARIEPLSPRRYKVQFTASADLRDKLERLTALMRPSLPDGDLAAVIEAAVTDKLDRLEARRFGRVKSPRRGSPAGGRSKESVQSAHWGPACERQPVNPADPPAGAADQAPGKPAQANASALTHAGRRSRHVPAEVRRTVYERDQGRCRFVDKQGRRCTARVYLELHHGIPYAVGGEHSPTNLGLLCDAHNRLMAEIDFGEKSVGEHRRRAAAATSAPATPRDRSAAPGEHGVALEPTK